MTTTFDGVDRLFDRSHTTLLLAIAEAKSFSGAAAALGVSQPSISQQVKRLEIAAGRRLFHRGATGVSLTSDGEAVLVYARAMAALTDDLRRHFRDSGEVLQLSIGMSEDFCRTALPTVLWLFLREHPLVEMRMTSGSVDELMAAVRSREVDLAVMRRDPAYPDVTPVWTDRVCWTGRSDLPMPIADPVPLALPFGPSPMRNEVMSTLKAHGRTWRVAFEARGLTGVEAALQAGIGVCAGPRSMRLLSTSWLGPEAGLPDLPDAEFVMSPPNPMSGGVAAFAEILKQAAISSFRAPDAPGG